MGIAIHAPRNRVFEHLLMPHHLARWWCSFAQVTPKPGGAFNFGGDYCVVPPEGHAHKCTFTGGEIRRSVTFMWPLFGADTTAKWEVEDAGSDANFRVIHQGLTRPDGACGDIRDAYRACLGNLKAICENRGDSLRPEYAPLAKPVIQLPILIEAPSQKVFEALDSANRLLGWATRAFPGQVQGQSGGLDGWESTAANVLSEEFGRRLALTWPQGGTINWDLEAKASGTGVYFRHEGAPGDEQALRNLRGWWSSLLVDLKNHLETGEVGFLEAYAAQRIAT